MTAEQIRHARDLLTRPDNTVSSIARLLGACCYAGVMRYHDGGGLTSAERGPPRADAVSGG